jgi:hypothetical protein
MWAEKALEKLITAVVICIGFFLLKVQSLSNPASQVSKHEKQVWGTTKKMP